MPIPDLNLKLGAYIKYLRHEQELNHVHELDNYQVQILNLIAAALHNNKTVCVGDIICHKEIASAATLHAALHKLINKELVNYSTKSDSRIKILNLSKDGWDRYITLSSYIEVKNGKKVD